MKNRAELRYRARELRELGFVGSSFRIAWELKVRSGYYAWRDRAPSLKADAVRSIAKDAEHWPSRLWFSPPLAVAQTIQPFVNDEARRRILTQAEQATQGRLIFFSNESVDCSLHAKGSDAINWHRDPITGQCTPLVHWGIAARGMKGDIKDLWEMGRFPHAYAMVRAAALAPELRPRLAESLTSQIDGFIRQSPFAKGVHWLSGQEIAFRLFAFVFAYAGLLQPDCEPGFRERLARHFYDCAVHIERHIDYARYAVYNNHLLSEAAALMLVAHLLPNSPRASTFHSRGFELFDGGVRRQFYEDGGYIQQAHNYHRVALHDLVWAVSIVRAGDKPVPALWVDAARRSIDFLRAQQSMAGSLPNYGNNDGALILPLSSCDYDDFRPVLQNAASTICGERIFSPGPWDEEAAWFGSCVATNLLPESPRSRSFAATGQHVLRGANRSTFTTFRCGTLRDRFTHMDMLNVDIHWRGHNVVADPGTYRYNGAPVWNAHFMGTASHSTVTVDDQDQMVHFRQFKTLYPARARLLRFVEDLSWRLCVGEHEGYRRLASPVVHRRSVLSVEDDLWVVVDTLSGGDEHSVRLHWQLGAFPLGGSTVLRTEAGDFELRIFASDGERLTPTVVEGQSNPPRGWISRRYGTKRPAPSVAVSQTLQLPDCLITIMGAAPVSAERTSLGWEARAGGVAAEFSVEDGVPVRIHVKKGAA